MQCAGIIAGVVLAVGATEPRLLPANGATGSACLHFWISEGPARRGPAADQRLRFQIGFRSRSRGKRKRSSTTSDPQFEQSFSLALTTTAVRMLRPPVEPWTRRQKLRRFFPRKTGDAHLMIAVADHSGTGRVAKCKPGLHLTHRSARRRVQELAAASRQYFQKEKRH